MSATRRVGPDSRHSHAAWVACRAAMAVRRAGGDAAKAALAYTAAYSRALTEVTA